MSHRRYFPIHQLDFIATSPLFAAHLRIHPRTYTVTTPPTIETKTYAQRLRTIAANHLSNNYPTDLFTYQDFAALWQHIPGRRRSSVCEICERGRTVILAPRNTVHLAPSAGRLRIIYGYPEGPALLRLIQLYDDGTFSIDEGIHFPDIQDPKFVHSLIASGPYNVDFFTQDGMPGHFLTGRDARLDSLTIPLGTDPGQAPFDPTQPIEVIPIPTPASIQAQSSISDLLDRAYGRTPTPPVPPQAPDQAPDAPM